MKLTDLTMDSDFVQDLLERIGSTSSKNEKIAIIEANKENLFFQQVLFSALNPLLTYGISKITHDKSVYGENSFDVSTMHIIEQLSTRELSGNDALDAVDAELKRLTPKSAELFKRIILKDLKAGIGDSSVNKAIKGLIPEFPYMRCSLIKNAKLDKWAWGEGAISQLKADGMFTNTDHDDSGEVRMSSRQGQQYPLEEFAELVEEIKATLDRGTQTHGEIIVLKDGVELPREISNGIMNHVISGGRFGEGEKPQLQVWEQIPLAEVKPKNVYEVGYKKRLINLIRQLSKVEVKPEKITSIKLIDTVIVHSFEAATEHFRKVLKEGKEGTIMKEPNAPWKDGTSTFQIKRKLDVDVELEVIGFEEGNGKNEATFGSLICKSADGLLQVSVSGFSDDLRSEIHANRSKWLGSIITVRFNAIMRATEEGELNSLFLPRFVELRSDKTEADTFPRIEEQYEAAINEV